MNAKKSEFSSFESNRKPQQIVQHSECNECNDYEMHLANLDPNDVTVDDFLAPRNFEALSFSTPAFYWYLFPGLFRLVVECPDKIFSYFISSINSKRITYLAPEKLCLLIQLLESLKWKLEKLTGFERSLLGAKITKCHSAKELQAKTLDTSEENGKARESKSPSHRSGKDN